MATFGCDNVSCSWTQIESNRSWLGNCLVGTLFNSGGTDVWGAYTIGYANSITINVDGSGSQMDTVLHSCTIYDENGQLLGETERKTYTPPSPGGGSYTVQYDFTTNTVLIEPNKNYYIFLWSRNVPGSTYNGTGCWTHTDPAYTSYFMGHFGVDPPEYFNPGPWPYGYENWGTGRVYEFFCRFTLGEPPAPDCTNPDGWLGPPPTQMCGTKTANQPNDTWLYTCVGGTTNGGWNGTPSGQCGATITCTDSCNSSISVGSLGCKDGTYQTCNSDGTWTNTGTACTCGDGGGCEGQWICGIPNEYLIIGVGATAAIGIIAAVFMLRPQTPPPRTPRTSF